MDGEAEQNEPMEVPPPAKKKAKVRKKPKAKAKRRNKKSKKVAKRVRKRGNKKARVGRPSRGEGTTVVGVVLKKGERQGVRVADSLFKKLVSASKAAGVPQSVLLRAGGIYLAELIGARRWKPEQMRAFLKKYGGAS